MARYSKFIAAVLAFAGVVASSGLLDGQAQAWTNCIIAAVGAALVYLIPNADLPTDAD
jgi:hypothetical protein